MRARRWQSLPVCERLLSWSIVGALYALEAKLFQGYSWRKAGEAGLIFGGLMWLFIFLRLHVLAFRASHPRFSRRWPARVWQLDGRWFGELDARPEGAPVTGATRAEVEVGLRNRARILEAWPAREAPLLKVRVSPVAEMPSRPSAPGR